MKSLKKKVEERTSDLIKQNNEYSALNQEYKNINEELLLAKEKAEESDRLKTAFLQNMSHEIRTPMNAIMGFSSLLADYYDNKNKLLQFSDIIKQRCNDLLDIINDILDIAKIESGQLTINIDKCNVSELFSEIQLFFNGYKKRNGKDHILFSAECSDIGPDEWFKTDKVKLKQILINLIGNAFKFTDEGSIICSCQRGNGGLIFMVADTGIGIPPDKFEFIFERFSQLNQRVDTFAGGTGLGLPIAKALTGMLGGTIWLESNLGQGSKFYFSVPCTIFSEAKPIPPAQNDKLPETLKTILVVEDDVFNTQFLKEVLQRSNFVVITAGNGFESIRIVNSQQIDLVLMDIRLPDISGYEAIRHILNINPRMKIIAQTAHAGQDEKNKALLAGCIGYISKPINRDVLIALLKTKIAD
jgi:signal transduction histidine kinase/CheY-like chemotaxis protein